ncbi:hypothetical protein ERJ75_001567900 [Trypanosoma vivax]|nr:hypothetical protein ERJ75_001567900 [Trypanosoma vivax]
MRAGGGVTESRRPSASSASRPALVAAVGQRQRRSEQLPTHTGKCGRPGVGAPVPEGMSHSGARRCGRRGVERQFRRERALGSDCAHGVTLARARDAGLGFRLRGRRRAGAQGRKHHHDVRTASPGSARRE